MTQVVKTHVAQFGLLTDSVPKAVQRSVPLRSVPSRCREYPAAVSFKPFKDISGRLREPDRPGTRLAVAQKQVALAIVGPAQGHDFALAAPGEQKKANDRDLKRTPGGMGRQPLRQPADLVIGQETLASLPAVPPDAAAGVGPLGPKAHPFRLPHDDGKHRHGPVGGDRCRAERSEPVPDLPRVDVGDRAAGEMRQQLAPQIAAVRTERSRLPDPLVTLEHGLGDGLEAGLAGPRRRALASPDCREYPGCVRPRINGVRGRGVADDLPNAFYSVLTMDEVALAARGQHPHAEAFQLAVADIVGGPARP